MLGMLPPKDKIASLILAKASPSGADQMTQGPEVEKDADVAYDSVAQKLLSAIEKKDKQALISGLKEFLDIEDSQEGSDEAEG